MTEVRTQGLKRLRRELKQQRRATPPADQRIASKRVLNRLRQHRAFQNAKSIGGYVATNGEVDLKGLSVNANQKHFLPVLQELVRPWKGKGLLFGRTSTRLHKNRYGIPEPRSRVYLEALALDYLLVPLLGFDRQGNRLGMGGGYYDRALAARNRQYANGLEYGKKTFLMGVAYSFQEVEPMLAKSWDVPLDGVVTDRELLLF